VSKLLSKLHYKRKYCSQSICMKYTGYILLLIVTSMLMGFFSNAQHFIFKTYTVEDGLVANPVRRIYQDSKGFIWIATWEGLSKYDGHKFTNYTIANGLSHNMVNDIYESADGKLYVAENNGSVDILQQDAILKKGAFTNVVINQFNITQDHKVIAVTDKNGLYEIKNGNLVKPAQIFPRSTYRNIKELNDSLLIGGDVGSLRILNRQYKLFSEIKEPPELLILKIYKDSKNKIWVGTNNGLKLMTPVQKNNPLHFTLMPASFNIPLLKNGVINDMLEDANGNFWIATANGLVKIYPDGSWQLFSEKDGLPSANVSCIYQDREKNIWIGTMLGLTKLVTKNNIRIYTIGNGLSSNNVSFLLPLKNDIFLTGTETGMQLFNCRNGLFSSVSSQHHFFYNGFVENSQPALFYSHHNGFGKYDPIGRHIIDYILPSLPKTEVYCSIMDSNGIIFNGTHTGLFIGSKEKSSYERKFSFRITSLLIDKKGYLWVGTWENGLYRIHYSSIKDKSNRLPNPGDNQISLSVQDFSDLLPDKNIRCLFEDDKGNIWIGTRYQGIVQLKNNNGEHFEAQHFNLGQGLMSNSILAVSEDIKGCIWIGSNLGIDKLIPADKTFRVFNFSRVNNYFGSINAILPGSDHSLWFLTNKGLVNISDGETEKTPAAPVYITSVNLGDTSFNYNTYHTGTKVQLKYYQNQAKFEFSAPGFINEKQILYSYRLSGSADTMWSEPSNLHNVSYTSLQPGNYHFEVRTLGWNGEWGTPANFLFIIRPPYWQTWWFYTLVGFAMLSIFYALYFYRIRQLLKVQKVRNRIATDLHDDIGATLTNINMLSEISRKNLERPQEAEKFLQRISEEVTSSSQALNDIIWNVNSRNDSMEEILLRMRRYAAELFDNSKTSFHLNLDETVAGKKINMEQRRDVYLIYKESMNNIFKHACANNVWIDVQWQNGKLHLKIKDDGKGFDSSAVTSRNGLRNIHSRTEKWKGITLIKTSPGNGTLIEIIFPVSG
jgi:ligand-binding sensor domain-containing protein/two-component sensor histidine kinase